MPNINREAFWTIPNVLTLYRLIIFPFILFLIFKGREGLFAVFITISLITDILDGLIARVFKMKTKIGAKLDSWADTGTYILAFLAIYFFKWEQVEIHLYPFIFFLVVLIISYVVVFIKFKGLLGLHTYLFKMTGYWQGAFIVILFLYGFNIWLYYISMISGIVACTEEIIIILIIPEPRSDVKGLYWVIKKVNQ